MSYKKSINIKDDIYYKAKKISSLKGIDLDNFLNKIIAEVIEEKDFELKNEIDKLFRKPKNNDKKTATTYIGYKLYKFLNKTYKPQGFKSKSDYFNHMIDEFFEYVKTKVNDANNILSLEVEDILFEECLNKEDIENIKDSQRFTAKVDKKMWNKLKVISDLFKLDFYELINLMITWYSRTKRKEIKTNMNKDLLV